jgi:RND family efflux transporter MFP subunit
MKLNDVYLALSQYGVNLSSRPSPLPLGAFMSNLRTISIVGGLILTIIVGWMIFGSAKPPSAPVAQLGIPVLLGDVIPAPGAGDIHVIAKLKAVHEQRLAFKVGGLIKAMRVDVGDRVTRGQVLAELDLKEVNSQTVQSRASLEKALRDVERAKQLVKAGAAPQQRADDAQTAVEVARAGLEGTSFNQGLARIIASEDGVILARTAEAGEIIAPGTPILTLGDLSGNFLARAGLADRDVVRVAMGDKALLTMDALPGVQLTGSVTRIAAMSDPRTGTFDVEVTLDDHPDAIASGLVADLSISPSRADQDSGKLAVPVTAVLEGHGADAFVFLYDAANSTAIRRRINIGAVKGAFVIVNAGLKVGDKVITQGASYLRDGNQVQLATTSRQGVAP